MERSKARILIADDHELVREGLKRVLYDSGVGLQVGEAGDGDQALQLARQGKWHLVILDLNLPGRSGLEVLKMIKAERPHQAVLVLSILPEEQAAIRVLRAGADGYLFKGTAARDLVRAVETVLAGGKYISASVAAELIERMKHPASANPHETLSDREDEVFHLIVAGRTVGEIAAQLRLSVKTVSGYRANMLRKLNVRNNAQVMRYAFRRGLGEARETAERGA